MHKKGTLHYTKLMYLFLSSRSWVLGRTLGTWSPLCECCPELAALNLAVPVGVWGWSAWRAIWTFPFDMTYTAQNPGADLSKVDGTSAFLNFLHRDNCQEILFRGETIFNLITEASSTSLLRAILTTGNQNSDFAISIFKFSSKITDAVVCVCLCVCTSSLMLTDEHSSHMYLLGEARDTGSLSSVNS